MSADWKWIETSSGCWVLMVEKQAALSDNGSLTTIRPLEGGFLKEIKEPKNRLEDYFGECE